MSKDYSRYIRFYTPGSAAVKVEIQDEQTWAPLPEPKIENKVAIAVDPVAVFGFLVAVCMLVLMAVGIHQLNYARREVVTLERYVASLTAENAALDETYHAGYEPAKIRQQALNMGMIPVEQVPQRHIYVTVTQPPVSEEQTVWSRFTTFLAGLFA